MHPPFFLLLFVVLLLPFHPLASAQTLIGPLSELQHDVSGTVYAINQRTLQIRDFTYDGTGPAAVYWLNAEPRATSAGRRAHSLPSCALEARLPSSSADTVEIELPADITLNDISYFSIWCQAVDAEFGGVQIPSSISQSLPTSIPICSDSSTNPMVEAFPVRQGWNCEPLSNAFQARWRILDTDIQVELVARTPSNTYMGFGPSGDDNTTQMVGSDVAIAYDLNSSFFAIDYHLETRDQCSDGVGVCRDVDLASSPGVDDIFDVSGNRSDQLLRVQYSRPLAATDPIDRPISLDGDTFVTWAIGPVEDGLPLFHQELTDYPKGRNVMIEFGRTPNNACPRSIPENDDDDDSDTDSVPGFLRPTLGNVQNITARIGPSAGARGYSAITGGNAWGIAWYLSETGTTDEDILIPALGVERGKTYTFRVYGGTPEEAAGFHPFYITNSSTGGYNDLSPAERQAEGVYAGIEVLERDAEGGVVDFTATAVGSLCLLETTLSDTASVETWEDYAASLDRSCTTNETITANFGTLVWTVPQDAPDLLYYQCVTHKLLGYRIVVFDEGEYNETNVEEVNGGGELTSRQNGDCSVKFKGKTLSFAACSKGVGGQVDVFFTLEGGMLKTLFRGSVGGGGYVGWGWGYSSMVGSNAMIVYDDGGEAKIDNFFLEQKETSGVQPAQANVSEVDADMRDGMLLGMFSREMNATGLPLLDSGENDLIWAVGSTTGSGNDLENHGRGARGSGRIDLTDAEVTSESGGIGKRLQAHGFLMGVSWCLLVPYAVLSMRFFKKYNPVTFQIHRGLNFTAIVMTVVGYLLVIFSESKTEKVHLGIGSFVVGAAVLQGTGGILRPHKESGKRRPWFYLHLFFGSVTMGLGFTNVLIGIGIAGGRARWYVLAVLGYASMWVLYIVFSTMPRRFPIYETAQPGVGNRSAGGDGGAEGLERLTGGVGGPGGDGDQVI